MKTSQHKHKDTVLRILARALLLRLIRVLLSIGDSKESVIIICSENTGELFNTSIFNIDTQRRSKTMYPDSSKLRNA
ncbi:hypothetical protein OUZ56_032908 [Daphnia magna]|uniref:Uncharacterized protein n=1 Tax=Daphnia magna TaxID=35525 RepID=A0ABQ9ZX54_9CRUS|nr:hypothetical protein OUZ56_032908 [Daphnia magna]